MPRRKPFAFPPEALALARAYDYRSRRVRTFNDAQTGERRKSERYRVAAARVSELRAHLRGLLGAARQMSIAGLREGSPEREDAERTSKLLVGATHEKVMASGQYENRRGGSRATYTSFEESSELVEVILRAGYTQADISRWLGVQQSTVSRALHSRRPLTTKMYARINDALTDVLLGVKS